MSDSIFYLWFNHADNRYQRHVYGLHCGDGVEVMVNGAWVQSRIEHSNSITHSHGWFLVTHPNLPLENLPVRRAA